MSVGGRLPVRARRVLRVAAIWGLASCLLAPRAQDGTPVDISPGMDLGRPVGRLMIRDSVDIAPIRVTELMNGARGPIRMSVLGPQPTGATTIRRELTELWQFEVELDRPGLGRPPRIQVELIGDNGNPDVLSLTDHEIPVEVTPGRVRRRFDRRRGTVTYSGEVSLLVDLSAVRVGGVYRGTLLVSLLQL